MLLVESILYLALGAVAVRGQSSSTTSSTISSTSTTTSRPTYSFNSASTEIFVSTDTSQTPDTYSASGTITSSVSVSYYNVSSVASTTSSTPTASSNFTLPSATATATWPANMVIQSSSPYVMQDVDITDLPTFTYTLLNETESTRELICEQQVKFCSTAGCAEPSATVNANFCNTATMGTRCTCDKGASNLNQWKWPVQMSDCLNRGTACNTACMIPGGTTAERTACKSACSTQLSTTCGSPGQYAANYAVSKENQSPSFTMVQGGTAGDGALTLKAVTSVMAIVVACTLSFVLF